jgi:diguanylate cyclase (GGDEF)-like protein
VTRDHRTGAAAEDSGRAVWVSPGVVADDRVAAIVHSIGEVAYEWRLDSDALSWGSNACEVLGIPTAAAIATGRLYAKLLDTDGAVGRFDAVTRSQGRDQGSGVPYELQYRLRTDRDGAPRIWVEDTGRWFAGADGRPVLAHGVVRVVTERHAREERLAYLSRFDDLTGEMNRFHLTEILAVTLDEAIRYRSSCGFLIVAIDNLARINEAYGFAIADEVIRSIAKSIRGRMRGGDTFGRFSGNKFGIVLKNCAPDDMAIAADRLLATVRDTVVETGMGKVAATVTIGGVVAPRHARTVEDILARSQESLEAAKIKRRGSFQAYRPSIERDALRRDNARATDEIVTALNERRILVAYEPVVEVASRRIAFHECLMRIRRPDGTLASASAVIPIAERLGLVRLIDHRMLELVIEDLIAMPRLRASLNVSPASTTDPDWWASLDGRLRAHPEAAGRITLEITESAAIHNLDETTGFVARAKELGCRIAIDDFGAGYTSFRNLRRLGVDIIKIDGAFVRDLDRLADDRVFVRTMIELGRGLGLATIAEWVQDERSAEMLAGWGCDYMQGVLVGLASLERPYGVEPAPISGAASA